MMRAFVAVPCQESVALKVSTLLDPLRGIPSIRWSRPEQYHLTLQFLGDWPDDRLEALERAFLDRSWPSRFSLPALGLGGFPDLKDARVLFLQLGTDDLVDELAAGVRQAVGQIWPDSPADFKAFTAHLTVGRVSGSLNAEARSLLAEIQDSSWPVLAVNSFDLMASELKPSGVEHTMLARIFLT